MNSSTFFKEFSIATTSAASAVTSLFCPIAIPTVAAITAGERCDQAGLAAMQDRDRFPESADWRLMSQLGERNSPNHRVHNTRGRESQDRAGYSELAALAALRASQSYFFALKITAFTA